MAPVLRTRATSSANLVNCRMATKPPEAENNSPRFDEHVHSIVKVNDRDVSVLSPSDLEPGDVVLVQHLGKHNKPGRRLWKAARQSVGIGPPPSIFPTNGSESLNKVTKQYVHYKARFQYQSEELGCCKA